MLDEWIHEAGNDHLSKCFEDGTVSEMTDFILKWWSWVAEMVGVEGDW